jgi:hypothetical protein
MSTTHRTLFAVLAAGAAVVLSSAGCQMIDTQPAPSDNADNTETVHQGLGESKTGYRVDGPGSGTLPQRNERVMLHLANRFRMNPFDEFELTDMQGNPIPAHAPARYSYVGSEAARWKSRYLLNNECSTPCDADGNPMTPPQFRSCCQVGLQNGKFTCNPPENVDCTSDMAMSQDERLRVYSSAGLPSFTNDFWFRQQLGPDEAQPTFPGEAATLAGLQNLVNFAISNRARTVGLGFVNQPVVPDECDPDDPCDPGTCRNSEGSRFCDTENNPECTGLCKGPECNGTCTRTVEGDDVPVSCTLPEAPDEEQCQPENYARRYQFTLTFGSSGRPRPTLLNGIHLKLGFFGENAPFGETPAEEIEYAIHYYEPSGPAQDAKVVVDGQCNDMSTRFEPDSAQPPPDTGGDAGDTGTYEFDYFGNTYNTSLETGPGCHSYYFSFVDGEGFVQTYPEYGALQARIGQGTDDNGNTFVAPLPNNESCPIWTPERPNPSPSCLPNASECSDGETRNCYTGTPQTRGVGVCSTGIETCVDGRWSGTCEDQTLPAADDTCGDNTDNDCNGYVDDQCGNGSGGDAGMTNPGSDAGMSDTGGSSGSDGGGLTRSDDDGESSGCGCRSTANSIPTAPLGILLVTATVFGIRRRSRDT